MPVRDAHLLDSSVSSSISHSLSWTVAHGTLGAPERNWFPWLTWQGIRAGVRVRVPRLPTPQNQSFESWARAFDEQAGPLNEHTIVIGHSTGVPFLLQLLQRRSTKVAAAFLVSGFAEALPIEQRPEMRPLIQSFVDFPFDGAVLRRLAGRFECFHGADDEIVPLAAGERLARLLKCPLRVIPEGRHLNTEARLFEFPALLEAVQNASEAVRAQASADV